MDVTQLTKDLLSSQFVVEYVEKDGVKYTIRSVIRSIQITNDQCPTCVETVDGPENIINHLNYLYDKEV